MSAIKVNQVQIGQSNTANNNFTWNVPVTPDGTIKLSRGVPGALGADVLSIGADGKISFTPGTGVGDVTLSGAQTLTNKTISVDNNLISGISASSFVLSDASGNIDGVAAQKVIPAGVVVGTTDAQTLTNKTLSNPTINDGYTEEIYSVSTSGAVSLTLTNGSIQVITHSGAITFSDSLSSGQSMLLGLTPGANTTTWPTITWSKVGGSGTAPTLTATGVNWIVLWKIGTTLRAAFLGTA